MLQCWSSGVSVEQTDPFCEWVGGNTTHALCTPPTSGMPPAAFAVSAAVPHFQRPHPRESPPVPVSLRSFAAWRLNPARPLPGSGEIQTQPELSSSPAHGNGYNARADFSFTLATRRKSQPKNRKSRKRLLLSTAEAEDLPQHITIPTRWLNNVIGLFLLPICWILTQALFTSFERAAVQHAFWATEEFWFFSLGAVLWMLAFFGSLWVFGEPRPLRVYVFGHELTHAIWAMAMGGKIFGFNASRDGGYVLTDKSNFWVALAPYFHPLYSVFVIAIYGVTSLFYDLHPYTAVLFGFLGLTWSFHFSFTLWMIPKGQTDLSAHGNFFSLVVIFLVNIISLAALLIFAAPEVTFHGFAIQVAKHAGVFAEFVMTLFDTGMRHFLRKFA